jgi:cytoskeletal protein RodZ
MTSVGDILRAARESQGRTLSEIAQELCVVQAYLRAIESGDVKNLPGLFFYKSFVRQYAAILAVDEKLIRPQLEALSAAEEPSPHPDIRVPEPLVEQTNRRFVPDIPLGWSLAGLAAVVLLCSGFYAWWTRVPVPAAASKTAVVINTQMPTQAAFNTQPVANSAPVANPTSVADSAPEALSGIVLKLSATERTWLSISSGGHEVFSGFLQPSESKTLTGLDVGTMRVGNAAGISVHLNGKPIGPLGERGQVLTIRFTSQDFEIVPPKEQPKQEL